MGERINTAKSQVRMKSLANTFSNALMPFMQHKVCGAHMRCLESESFDHDPFQARLLKQQPESEHRKIPVDTVKTGPHMCTIESSSSFTKQSPDRTHVNEEIAL